MAFKVNKRTVDALRPRAQAFVAFDCELKGFGVRVYPSGSKAYVVEYRPGAGGRDVSKRRFKLGDTHALTPDQARRDARGALARIRLGNDPAAERAASRAQMTVGNLIDEFLTNIDAKKKQRTSASYRLVLNKHLRPDFGNRKVDALTRPVLAKFHLSMKSHPYAANRLIAIVSSMYGYAAERHIVPERFNPARGIVRFSESPRELFLSGKELSRLGAAMREAETTGLPWKLIAEGPNAKHTPKKIEQMTRLSPHAVAAMRLLLFTGCRLREILGLRWSEVNLERGFLFLPDSKTGKKTIVLNGPAMAVLAALPAVGEFVIAGESAGREDEKPRADLKRPWAAVSRRANLKAVRIHDLRHTHASFGAAGGFGLPIIGKLLHHKHSATTARYAHLDVDPLRRASEQIGSRIADAMGDPKRTGRNAKVLPFRKNRRG